VIDGESHELPSFVGVAILTPLGGTLANKLTRGIGKCHALDSTLTRAGEAVQPTELFVQFANGLVLVDLLRGQCASLTTFQKLLEAILKVSTCAQYNLIPFQLYGNRSIR
jgi:hypothetical protein